MGSHETSEQLCWTPLRPPCLCVHRRHAAREASGRLHNSRRGREITGRALESSPNTFLFTEHISAPLLYSFSTCCAPPRPSLSLSVSLSLSLSLCLSLVLLHLPPGLLLFPAGPGEPSPQGPHENVILISLTECGVPIV